MAPIKFEESIKEKLDKRRLQPSKKAWDKLSSRLDAQEEKKNNKPYWWLGIAASIVGILFIVSQFLNNDNLVDDEHKVVTTPKVKIQVENNKIVDEEIKMNDFVAPNELEKLKVKESQIEMKTETIIKKNSLKESVAVNSEEKINLPEKDIKANSMEVLKEEMSFEDQKVNDVIAQVQTLKEENKVVTDEDIDRLLHNAQKEIRLNKIVNKTTGVVDANMLLQDVEADLEESFRSKVFEAIKSSYNSVKTAVAQRNN